MHNKTIWAGWLLCVLAACAPEQTSGPLLFDFDKLIDDQVSQLSQRRRVIEKVANVKGQHSDSTYIPSTEGWMRELEIFRKLSVANLSAYRKLYQVTDGVKDKHSNLKIRELVAAKAPVKTIRFYYQDDFSRLRRLEAELVETNWLFENARQLRLDFDEEDGQLLLHSYTMAGYQKMVFSDTVKFAVSGSVDW